MYIHTFERLKESMDFNMNNERPVVVLGYKKKGSLQPTVVKKREKATDTPVLVEKKKEEDGIHFQVKSAEVSNIELREMPKNIRAYLNSNGYDLDINAINELIASMTSHLIVLPYSTDNIRLVSLLSDYFSKNKFNASNKASFYQALYSAAFYPNQAELLMLSLTNEMPTSIIEYIKNPYVATSFPIEEYINDKYISQIRIHDNLFIFVLGDYKKIRSDLKGIYSLWNPTLTNVERNEDATFERISYDSFMNIHKSLNYKESLIWESVDHIDEILSENNIELSNEVLNSLDDYLAVLSNLNKNTYECLKLYAKNRLKPLLDEEVFKSVLKRLSIKEEI